MMILSATQDELVLGIPCSCCGEMTTVTVTVDAFHSWKQGALVQEAFPDLTPAERELFISSTCGDCWNSMFSLPTH